MKFRPVILLCVAIFGMMLFANVAIAARAVPLQCSSEQSAQIIPLPVDSQILDLSTSTHSGWLELEEAGQQIELTPSPKDSIYIPQPFRYGWHWVQVAEASEIKLRRAEPSRSSGVLRAIFHCFGSQQTEPNLGWLRAASAIGSRLDTPVDREKLSLLIADIQALENHATNSTARAISLHFRAEAFAANSRSAEGNDAFELAEQAWESLKDHDRTLAARLGRAEEQLNLGAYQEVLRLTALRSSNEDKQNYFSVRLENSRCLALQAIGRFDEAAKCLEWTLASYEKLDERAEYVVALQNYANLQASRGNLVMAADLASRGLDLVSGPDAPMLLGRLRMILGEIALRRGEVAVSLSHYGKALDNFERAGGGALRWQANALFFVAIIYSQTGAYDEAYGTLNEAIKRLNLKDAPSRLALAMNIFADIETDLHRPDSALLWRKNAEEIYTRLDMLPQLQATRAVRLELQSQIGDFDTVERALTTYTEMQSQDKRLWLILSAKLALKKEHLREARLALDQLQHEPLELRDQILAAGLEANYWELTNDIHSAQRILLQTASNISAIAERTQNSALQYLISRQRLSLQRVAMRIALRHEGDMSEQDLTRWLWQWLYMSVQDKNTSKDDSHAISQTEIFDDAIAQELLTPASQIKSSSESKAQRELLSFFAQSHTQKKTSALTSQAFSIDALQQHLADDSAFVAYLDGSPLGGLLWVTSSAARVLDAAAAEDLRTSVAVLRNALRSPASSIADIQNAAQTLSAQLLRGVPHGVPPKHLFVFADEIMPGIAWNTLTWPGHSGPILDSTSVEFVRFDNSASDESNPDTPAIHVLVSSQQQVGNNPLASLATANFEPQLIQAALAPQTSPPISISGSTAATREAVFSALNQPNAWIHIAAHGTAQPQRIGYAGLWLATSGMESPDFKKNSPKDSSAENISRSNTPAFLSWLDILDRGVRADLVVLNACQLGDSGTAINGNLSFAAAVSRAGAKQVVAALWPVSDSAAALWVPAFYSALAADPNHNAAEALRVAQLRLRASRAFAHPFFWAGFQATSRMSLSGDMRPATAASLQKKTLH